MYYTKQIFLSLFIFISGYTAFAQQHQHKEHLSTLLEHYLDAKEALAGDDFDKARSSLIEFRKEVLESDEINHHEEHSQMHVQHHASMVNAVNDAAEADDMENLRASFKTISDNLIKTVKNQNYDSKELHLQYCPMADGGEGAQWISDQEAIVNPYMGQKMPGCGKTEEVIE